MNLQSLDYSETFSEKFSIASLLYIRLRRASSRVIDVMYMCENDSYAEYVLKLALATQDEELHKLAQRIRDLLPRSGVEDEQANEAYKNLDGSEDIFNAKPTDDDVFRAQVSHHYIGSLR